MSKDARLWLVLVSIFAVFLIGIWWMNDNALRYSKEFAKEPDRGELRLKRRMTTIRTGDGKRSYYIDLNQVPSSESVDVLPMADGSDPILDSMKEWYGKPVAWPRFLDPPAGAKLLSETTSDGLPVSRGKVYSLIARNYSLPGTLEKAEDYYRRGIEQGSLTVSGLYTTERTRMLEARSADDAIFLRVTLIKARIYLTNPVLNHYPGGGVTGRWWWGKETWLSLEKPLGC